MVEQPAANSISKVSACVYVCVYMYYVCVCEHARICMCICMRVVRAQCKSHTTEHYSHSQLDHLSVSVYKG